MAINSLAKEEVLRSLGTSEHGLTEGEARKRYREFGPNEIREARKTPLIARFIKQFTHFLAILLWIAAGLAFLSDYLHPGEGMATLGFAIIGVIFINAIFTFVQEYRAEKSIESLRRLLPFNVKVVRDGREREIPAREIVVGDMIILSGGDRVPADARLIESRYMMVNNASLTGESEPIALHHEPCEGDLLGSRNVVFAGTTVLSGSGRAVVFATGMSTEFGHIARLTGTVEPGLSPLQIEIIRLTRIIALIATLMGIIFFLAGRIIGMGFWENFIFAIGIIVANVPEGLLPTVTLALAMGSQRMAKRKALIKNLVSVESLGSVTVICTDKTGTLTQNRMEVKGLWFNGAFAGVEKLAEAEMLCRVSYLCNNAKYLDGRYKGDPTEVALLKAVREYVGDLESERIYEIPFDSERKRMSTVNLIDGERYLLTKGAPEGILDISTRILLDNETITLKEHMRERILKAYNSLTGEGLRVLGLAYRIVAADEPLDSGLERDMIFAGLVGLEDPPRPEVPEAIRRCREAGIRIIMITGDSTRTALAIAREIGLVKGEPVIIEGEEFRRLTDRQLRKRLSHEEVIFARMTPKYKMRVVSLLKELGHRVAVTGDGVNDAPALKGADIGIAMGITGTDVARESADMVLLDDNFATIVNAIEEGRAVYDNIRKFISYIFSSNIPEIVPYLAYVLLRIPLPLTILQILAVDLGTDMLPALALGAERPTQDLMKRPPRRPDERLLNIKILSRAYLFLGPIEAAAGMTGYFYVLYSNGWKWGEMLSSIDPVYMQATTACLTAIVITQVANVFACRSFTESVFRIGFFTNRLIFVGIAFEIIFQLFIVYHPWGNGIFSTHPINLRIWLILIPFALVLFAAEEFRKLIVRRYGV
ncbi:MAG TPA: cation-transporting P-type ATPase [Nitrospirae bacterium]|nr:cation-transporting P-type ATPase [Nitrospirota bacterium]